MEVSGRRLALKRKKKGKKNIKKTKKMRTIEEKRRQCTINGTKKWTIEPQKEKR